MFHKKTVFVLGAGFSAELGMPMGGELADKIVEALSAQGQQNSRYCNLMRAELGAGIPCEAIQAQIIQALPHARSIDNLVEHYAEWPEFAVVAKHAIAKCIVRAEAAAHIQRTKDGFSFKPECARSAAAAIVSLALQGVHQDQLRTAFQNISFINFNYDRCLETYIYWVLRSYSGLSHVEATHIVADINIWHPYGYLGPIADLNEQAGSVLPFATEENDERLMRLQPFAARLKTYSESEASAGHDEAKEWINEAKQIIFLGCAYHLQNLDLLAGAQHMTRLPRIYGTYYRPPAFDVNVNITMEEFIQPNLQPLSMRLRDRLCGRSITAEHPHGPKLHGLTCRQLVDMYDHSWTMED